MYGLTDGPPSRDEALEIPYIYASGREGYASEDPAARSGTIQPLLDLVLERIPPPMGDPDRPLQMMVTTLNWSEYVGRICIGRIAAGQVRSGQEVSVMQQDGTAATARVEAVELFDKLERTRADQAAAGDIVALITDGVYEYENPQEEQFQTDRTAEVIRAHHTGPMEKLVEELLRAVDAFGAGAPQNDDITIVLARRVPD